MDFLFQPDGASGGGSPFLDTGETSIGTSGGTAAAAVGYNDGANGLIAGKVVSRLGDFRARYPTTQDGSTNALVDLYLDLKSGRWRSDIAANAKDWTVFAAKQTFAESVWYPSLVSMGFIADTKRDEVRATALRNINAATTTAQISQYADQAANILPGDPQVRNAVASAYVRVFGQTSTITAAPIDANGTQLPAGTTIVTRKSNPLVQTVKTQAPESFNLLAGLNVAEPILSVKTPSSPQDATIFDDIHSADTEKPEESAFTLPEIVKTPKTSEVDQIKAEEPKNQAFNTGLTGSTDLGNVKADPVAAALALVKLLEGKDPSSVTGTTASSNSPTTAEWIFIILAVATLYYQAKGK